MTEKHCCVINAEKRYVTYVLVLVDQGVETVQNYTLHEGEQLIDATPPRQRTSTAPDGYIVPVWDGAAWTEGATKEEVAAWNELHPDWLETDGIARIRYKMISIIRDDEGKEVGREAGCEAAIQTQMEMQAQNITFLENCLLEMGDIVYA